VQGFYIHGGRVEVSNKFIDSRSSYAGMQPVLLMDVQVLPYSGVSESPFIKLYGNGIIAINSVFGDTSTNQEVTWLFSDQSDITATFINTDFVGDYVLTWADNTTIFPQNHKITHISTRWYDGSDFHHLSDRSHYVLNAIASYPDGYGDIDNTVTRLNVYGSDWYWLGSSGGEISGLDNGYLGQKITLVCNGSTTIKNNSEILLNGSTDFVCDSASTLTLINARYYWAEVGRSTR